MVVEGISVQAEAMSTLSTFTGPVQASDQSLLLYLSVMK